MLKLYDYFRSSACFRVRIALNLKDLDYVIEPIHLMNNGGEQHSLAYQKINPQSLVPVLQDGENRLSQSLAILEYLEEKFPSPRILPSNPYQKSLVRAFALAIAADTHPLNNLRVLNYLTNTLKISPEQKQDWYENWVAKTFSALEKQLSAEPNRGPYCFGDQPSMADICLVPQMYNARRFSCDLSSYPLLVAIDEQCQKHEAFTKAFPVEIAA